MNPQVTKFGVFDLQVCVPNDWTDEQIVEFANVEAPCGTRAGWQIRKEGDSALNGDPERQPCKAEAGMVHVMLDA